MKELLSEIVDLRDTYVEFITDKEKFPKLQRKMTLAKLIFSIVKMEPDILMDSPPNQTAYNRAVKDYNYVVKGLKQR
jgi:hypothetical protein